MSFCFCVFWGLQKAAFDYAQHTKKQNPCLFICLLCLLACSFSCRGAWSTIALHTSRSLPYLLEDFFCCYTLENYFNLLCALEEIHFVKILQEIGRWVCCWKKKKKKPKPCLHEKLFLFFLSVFVFIFRWFLVVENIPSEQHVLCLELYRLSWFFLCCHLLLLPAFHAFSCVHSVDKSCSS